MKKYLIEIKWALIFILMMLTWMIVERLSGLHDTHIDKHAIFTNFIAIPAITIYVFALLDKRKNFYQGKMTYKQGFMSGLIITLIVTIFTPLIQYLISTVISPNYFQNVIDFAVSKGKMTQEEAEGYFNIKSYIIQSLIGTPVMGIATTAIIAAFTRKPVA